ncbi:sensor domain-containing diguanylate cyclase [Desulfoplanes sp.]
MHLADNAYLFSPFWLTIWKARFRAWGFDQTLAREFFHDISRKLVFVDTKVLADARPLAREVATYLDLPLEIIPAGTHYFHLKLVEVFLEGRTARSHEEASYRNDLDDLRRQTADYAAALDLLGRLNRSEGIVETATNILDIFSMLFAPGHLLYLRILDGNPERLFSGSHGEILDDPTTICRLAAFDEEYGWTESGNGFILRFTYKDEVLGVLEVDHLNFPEYKEYYLNMALSMVNICSLAIENVRKFEQIRAYTSRIERQAFLDSLTGAYNRAFFFNALEGEIKRSERYSHPLSVLFLDIDLFKNVNDTYGHAAGDMVLCAFTEACREELRDNDVLGRIGGEEFAVLLPEIDADNAMTVAERLRETMEALCLEEDGRIIRCTVSVGLTQWTREDNADSLVKRADNAMYTAKTEGRNRSVSLLAGSCNQK